jgi:hypothetical protein
VHYPFHVPLIEQAFDVRGTGFALGTSFAQLPWPATTADLDQNDPPPRGPLPFDT